MQSLVKRSDFIRLKSAPYFYSSKYFLLKAHPSSIFGFTARFGLIITKKQGNAVLRNRMRRVFSLARKQQAHNFIDGFDYLFIIKREILTISHDILITELDNAMSKIIKIIGSLEFDNLANQLKDNLKRRKEKAKARSGVAQPD